VLICASKQVQREYEDLCKRFAGQKVMLGIDRYAVITRFAVSSTSAVLTISEQMRCLVYSLDYIKGIPHKLFAIERFFQNHPEWIGKVVLIQIAVPSRETVREYQRLKSLTHELVMHSHQMVYRN